MTPATAVARWNKRSIPPPPRKIRRNLNQTMESIHDSATRDENFYESEIGKFDHCGGNYSIRRYLFMGPPGGTPNTRIGLFGGIHGDEQASALAVIRFLQVLCDSPELATGFEIFAYPVCNPTGFEDNTRWSRHGVDLNREFWRDSHEPEVIILERQLLNLEFDGIIALHADDTSDGVYGYANGDTLTRNLLEPGLRAAEAFLPRNRLIEIDGWSALDGIIDEGFAGVLSAPPSQQPRPFEIVFETPQLAPLDLQIDASVAALLAILSASRSLQAHAANI
ncbi:MAG: M14 family metallopeptidase [Chthoniobacterales bacterium]